MRLSTCAPSLFSLLPLFAAAWAPPAYPGFNTVWCDSFEGGAGSLPLDEWHIITGRATQNAELETYTSSVANVQRSGGHTLQLVPWRDGGTSGGWTSGRVESRYTFTPGAGRVTMVEAIIRFGDNRQANKKGIWPAFWLLGDAIRTGTPWPACGEVDIMEQVNGDLRGYGTLHCDVYPGGLCNEPNGIAGNLAISDNNWHTWRVVWDRRANSWTGETITWFLDGRSFFQVDGTRVGNQVAWASLAQKPLFFILNVAVGGTWVCRFPPSCARKAADCSRKPGYPDDATLGGYGSMMEAGYVAHYASV